MTTDCPLAIEGRRIVKVFGSGTARVEALGGIDVRLARGEFVAVMGPSGSGKSTLLHVLSGLEPATEGEVLIHGQPLSRLSDDALTLLRRRELGFIFQAFHLLEVLTALENVALPLVIDGTSEAEANRRAREALARTGMEARRGHRPTELSGGEQQRVAIARAIVMEPSVLLADEPTGNLDSANGHAIMHLLRTVVEEQGQTVLMVTHDMDHAALADRLIQLRDGRIVSDPNLESGTAGRGAWNAEPLR